MKQEPTSARWPIPITTVFISSRMEELAIERRAAFNAIHELGLTPLLFETEPASPGLKAQLDNLVDRSDAFVGLYYRTFGAEMEQLFHMTPIEYEFFRFVTVWRIRYELDPSMGPRSAPHGSDGAAPRKDGQVGDRKRAKAGRQNHEEQQTVDRLLGKQFGTLDQRNAFLKVCHELGGLDTMQYDRVRRQLPHDIRQSLSVVRNRMCLFARRDKALFVHHGLLRLIGSQVPHFVVQFGSSRIESANEGQVVSTKVVESAARYREPHVDLYRRIKSRWLDAASAKTLLIEPAPRPKPKDCLATEVVAQDRVGLLEQILSVYFELGLNIDALALRQHSKGGVNTVTVLLIASPFGTICQTVALDDLWPKLEIAIRRELGALDTCCSEHLAKPQAARRKAGSPPGSSRNLIPRICRIDPVPESKAELHDRFGTNAATANGPKAASYSLLVSGADVPGMYLTLARAIAESPANITMIDVGSGFYADRSQDTVLQRLDYFSGEVHVDLIARKDGSAQSTNRGSRGVHKETQFPRVEEGQELSRIQELKYGLLNLLGVQSILVRQQTQRPVPPTTSGVPAKLEYT